MCLFYSATRKAGEVIEDDEKETNKKERIALRILSENPNITARQFAEKMWSNSKAWEHRISHREMGTVRGAGMWLCAGSYLSKLIEKGLVLRD